MATKTYPLWSATDPADTSKTASISYDYDDVTLRILSFTFQNPTSKPINYSATSVSNGKNYSGTIPANTASATVTINNAKAQNRLNITLTPSGKLDGVEYSIQY